MSWEDINTTFDFRKVAIRITDYMGSGLNVFLLPPKTVIFKGIKNVRCETVHSPYTVHDHFQQKCTWYADLDTASDYSEDQVFAYICHRPLVLFDFTSNTNMMVILNRLSKAIDELKRNTKKVSSISAVLGGKDSKDNKVRKSKVKQIEQDMANLMLVTGVGVTVDEQRDMASKVGIDLPLPPGSKDVAEVDMKRFSVFHIDLAVTEMLRRDYPFLDGYMGLDTTSPLMGGDFHPEVCLFGTHGKVSMDAHKFRLCGNTTAKVGGGGAAAASKVAVSRPIIQRRVTHSTPGVRRSTMSSQQYNDKTIEDYEAAEFEYQSSYLCEGSTTVSVSEGIKKFLEKAKVS